MEGIWVVDIRSVERRWPEGGFGISGVWSSFNWWIRSLTGNIMLEEVEGYRGTGLPDLQDSGSVAGEATEDGSGTNKYRAVHLPGEIVALCL